MMNVLLVMPKTSGLWDEWATPPIGITYVSSYLKENGVQVYTSFDSGTGNEVKAAKRFEIVWRAWY